MFKEKNELKNLYLVSAFFEAARMGIGATVVMYMLSKGITLSDVAMIKLIQGSVILFAEIPTGLFADHFGRRYSVILAIFFSILSFLIYYIGSSLAHFIFADICNALALSFWSGAFDAMVVEGFKRKKTHQGSLESVFSKISAFDAGATMCGGLMGGVLAQKNPEWPFIFSAGLGSLTLCLAIFLLQEPISANTHMVETAWKKLKTNLLLAYKCGVGDKLLRPFYALQICIQFIFQPLLHYWQPYFKSIHLSLTEAHLGQIFFAYVGVQIVVSSLSSQVLAKRPHLLPKILMVESVLMGVGLTCMSMVLSFEFSLIAFLMVQGVGGSLRTLLGAHFNQYLPSAQRATILSSVSFISRIGMLMALLVIKWLVLYISVPHLFFVSVGAVLFLYPLLIWYKTSSAQKKISDLELNLRESL